MKLQFFCFVTFLAKKFFVARRVAKCGRQLHVLQFLQIAERKGKTDKITLLRVLYFQLRKQTLENSLNINYRNSALMKLKRHIRFALRFFPDVRDVAQGPLELKSLV